MNQQHVQVSTIADEVTTYLQEQRSSFVDFVKALVRQESPSTEPATQGPVLGRIERALCELDYKTLRLPGRQTGGHLYARPHHRPRGQACQLLIGHGDTVWPLGTLEEMPVEIEDGRLKGPGVYDMKAGLAQIVFALRTLHALDLTPSVTPVVLVTSDEEVGSFESQPHIERLARMVNRALVLEPSLGRSGKIKTARKGVGEFEIVVQGKAAHAGLAPEEGASAILELTYVVQKLFALNDPEPGITVNVGTLDGGIRTNMIAPKSRVSVEVRVPTMEQAREIEQRILQLESSTPGVSLDIQGGIGRVPMERTPRNQVLWEQCQRLGRKLGLELEDGLSGGASDGNITSQFTATLDGLGAVGDGAHAYHEYIDIDKTLERCALLTLLLLAPPVPASS